MGVRSIVDFFVWVPSLRGKRTVRVVASAVVFVVVGFLLVLAENTKIIGNFFWRFWLLLTDDVSVKFFDRRATESGHARKNVSDSALDRIGVCVVVSWNIK